MKKHKNNLDEMQEQKLLKIEHTGFWLAFWGLLGSMYLQIAMGNGGIACIGGEAVILVVISVYLLMGCLRNGIWDRKLKPNFKTNFLISLGTGLALGGFWGVMSYHRYHALAGSLATFAIMFLFASVATLTILSLVMAAYQRKRRQLDDLEETE